jgi:hypothetical protein
LRRKFLVNLFQKISRRLKGVSLTVGGVAMPLLVVRQRFDCDPQLLRISDEDERSFRMMMSTDSGRW